MNDQPRYPDSFFGQRSDSGTHCVDKFTADLKQTDRLVDRWVNKLKRMPKVRLERIREIKKEIENDTYITDDKWSAACRALLGDLRD